MKKTRLSLFYLGSYLTIIGLGCLLRTIRLSFFCPTEITAMCSHASRECSCGLSVFGMIRAHASDLYPATLLMRVYFIACIVAFYAMTFDPFFLVLIAIVGIGFVLTLSAYLLDRRST